MELKKLGISGLAVSPLCFGTLTVGPLQKNFSPLKAAELISQAVEHGINFFDTAEIYGTYDILGLVIRKYPDIVIASKSYAVTAAEMKQSIDSARKALNRDYIDLFCLHEVENAATLNGHREALEYLYEAKAKGIIKAVGISTHTVAGVRAGATEPGIEVIHPLINKDGIGIIDGSVQDMIEALHTAKEFGKGIYAMKALAGGHLISQAQEALTFIRSLNCIDSVAIGMQSLSEIKLNILLVTGATIPEPLLSEVKCFERSLQIASWCRGCGLCIEKCGFNALALIDGKLTVKPENCVRCGYCARVCPDFCLKIV